MKNRLGRVTKVALVLLALLVAMASLGIWLGNRDVTPVSVADRQQAFTRAVSWMRANEAQIVKDNNVALWWFVRNAAERSGDPYLQTLVQRFLEESGKGPLAKDTWRRMVDPQAEVVWNPAAARTAEPYQRFMYHGLTCMPVELDGVDTNVYLRNDACHPQLTEVWWKDPACSTHHLVGVVLLQRSRCKQAEELAGLKADLLADIQQQMTLDVVVKDAYLQRLMMLMWHGQAGKVKSVWLQRALRAQQPDGGWIGGRQLPELPEGFQPWFLRAQLAKWLPARFNQASGSDFHASAQGLLIAALALEPAEMPRP